MSGGRELAALTGASHRIGAGAELRHEHEPVRHGESFDVGRFGSRRSIRPATRPEHVSYAVADRSRAEEPVLLMTGGSLLVGAVGRTDLLGDEHAVPYAHQMYRSLHDVLLPHEDFVGVYPTHGAGSLCSTGIASTPRSTIGYERRHNALLGPMDVDAFARALLSGQPTFPRYFARMRPTNQAGPRLLGPTIPASRPLGLDEVRAAIEHGALIVDARAPTAWTSAHVPGSVSIPAGSSFGTWLGWVVDPDRPTILVLEHAEDADDLMRQAFRVGHETIVGHVAGGFRTWVEAGLPIESTGRLTVDQLAGALGGDPDEAPFVLDVRQASEYEAGHVHGARHLTAGTLPDELDTLPRDKPIAVMCASGYRSSVAASLLDQAGFETCRGSRTACRRGERRAMSSSTAMKEHRRRPQRARRASESRSRRPGTATSAVPANRYPEYPRHQSRRPPMRGRGFGGTMRFVSSPSRTRLDDVGSGGRRRRRRS